MQDLLETTHFLTRVKVAPAAQGFFDGGSGEAKRAAEMAAKLSVPSLTRAWQILLKGLFEVRDATRPIAACEMALIRLAYAAELPPTDKLVRDLLDARWHGDAAQRPAPPRHRRRAARGGRHGSSAMRARARDPAPQARRRADVCARWKTSSPLLAAHSAPVLQGAISKTMCIWCGWSRARSNSAPAARAPRTLAGDLAQKLQATGPASAGAVSIAREGGAPTLAEQKNGERHAQSKPWRRSRWCAPCWTVFPARKSWPCATRRTKTSPADG